MTRTFAQQLIEFAPASDQVQEARELPERLHPQTRRKAYGFRTANSIEIALLHSLDDLPQPEFTHRFS